MNLYLPTDYVCNATPAPCDDLGGEPEGHWQPEVYERAKAMANGRTIIDIGCGRARKLKGYSGGVIGYDRMSTVEWLLKNEPWGTWVVADLEKPVMENYVSDCVIVCSDVIEHLIDPAPLLEWLASQRFSIILSTPDRERWRGIGHRGPPPNREHVREWSLDEFTRLVHDVFSGRLIDVIHTPSFVGGPNNTQLATIV